MPLLRPVKSEQQVLYYCDTKLKKKKRNNYLLDLKGRQVGDGLQ